MIMKLWWFLHKCKVHENKNLKQKIYFHIYRLDIKGCGILQFLKIISQEAFFFSFSNVIVEQMEHQLWSACDMGL